MVFVPVHHELTPAKPLNALDIARRLANSLPHEEHFRASDCILLRVVVDKNGNVKRLRALGPKMLGFIPRFMARVPAEWARDPERVRWADAPAMLAMAAQAGRELQFEPARQDDAPVSSVCRVVLPLHLPEEDPDESW